MPKILVIEDNPIILEEVLIWLELEEYEGKGVTNGRSGVEIAKDWLPDVIVCDIMMPEKDGYRVLLELRTYPSTSLIPLIFITAKQEKTDIRYAMEIGADDYITKPFQRNEFFGAIRARLGRRDRFLEESQRRVQSFRQNLLRTLPHELRTSLTGILGVGELLNRDAEYLTSADIIEYAELISISGRQLQRLIENYLLYAQLEIRAIDPNPVPLPNMTDVTEAVPVIRSSAETVANSHARLTDLRLELEPAALQISKQHASKMIYEIVDNAFKFSKASTCVKIIGRVVANRYLLTIVDHGRGMSAESLAQIDAYIQFERATFEQHGLGLGLMIARRLVEIHGGTFQMKSELIKGTTVEILLNSANH